MKETKTNDGAVTFKQSASIHNPDKYTMFAMNCTFWHNDLQPRTEAEWESIMKKVLSILESHDLQFKGQVKVMGKVAEEEEKSKLILPPTK